RPNKYTPPGGTGCARGTTLIPAPSAVPALLPGHGGFPARPRLRLTLGSEAGFGAACGPGSHPPRIARLNAGAYAPSSSPKYPYLYPPGTGPSMRAAGRCRWPVIMSSLKWPVKMSSPLLGESGGHEGRDDRPDAPGVAATHGPERSGAG